MIISFFILFLYPSKHHLYAQTERKIIKSMASKRPRCVAKKSDGKLRCTRDAIDNSLYCKQHHNKLSEDSMMSLNTEDIPSLSEFGNTSDLSLVLPNDDSQSHSHPLLDPNHTLVASLEDINEKNRKLREELTLKTIENTNLVNENRQLQTQLDCLTQQLSNMHIPNTVPAKKKRNYRKQELDLDDKAKRILYFEKKNDETMMAEIKTKLVQAGLLFKKKVKVYGGVQEKDLIPWQYKRAYVDYIWDHILSEEQRQTYRNRVT